MIAKAIHRQVGNGFLYFFNAERSVLPEKVKFFLLYFFATRSFLLLLKLAGILQGIELIRGSIQRVNTEETMMGLTGKLMITLCGFSLSLTMPAYAQLGSGQPDAASILNGMPQDVLAKVRSLAQILQQGLKDGKISDTDIQQGLTSGQLGEKLKQLSPEASQLFDEISAASQQRKGPGEEILMPLMGGLGVSPN
jgi:hypothetical protein